ncbi:MAG: hypothetical protein WD271_07565 [Acidimicrobiia bacterium]
MESHGVDTRMVWTGNALRQPAFAEVPHHAAPGGYPNADLVGAGPEDAASEAKRSELARSERLRAGYPGSQ